MNKCEELAIEQALKELTTISNIVSEVLQVSGYQQLQVQFSTNLHNLNLVFKEIVEK